MMTVLAILLIAFDQPVGGGVPSLIMRFDGESVRPIPAAFVGTGDTLPAIEWFLDGDGLLAPLAVSAFAETREPGDPTGLRRGHYQFAPQGVTKPTLFRGIIRTEPEREVRLLLFPHDHFREGWKRLAASETPVFLSGELPGLRPLLESAGVTFREADPARPESVDRNGLLIAQAAPGSAAVLPGLAKGVLIFESTPLASRSYLEASPGERMIVSEGPVLDFHTNPLGQQLILQLAEDLP